METTDLTPFLKSIVEPWYRSLTNPKAAQEETLGKLVELYARTDYGRKSGADDAKNLVEFQHRVPVVNYTQLLPYFARVRGGDHSALLAEPVERWVMTRGTTGTPKIVPTTRTHLAQILMVGARAIINFALKKGEMEVLLGYVLNLNFPSEVAKLHTPAGEETYGYSSGTYAKLNPELGPARLVLRQEEIDALGGGTTERDWENRFELVYQRTREVAVKSVIGVTPVMTAFARHVRRVHHVFPRDLWKLKGLFCTSVPKIQTKYAPILRHYFGNVPVVEMYTATEGVFAQQLDNYPYVCPNYDSYLFEAKTRRGMKMLYDMKPGEWGRIVISTPLFPRYDIGDMVEAMGKGYFRIFGRANKRTVLEHVLYNVLTGKFL